MKESEVIRAMAKVEAFLGVVKLVLGEDGDARETAKALKRPCEQGEHAVVCAKALCEYVADTKDTKRLQRLRELGEMAERILRGDHGTWPLSRPLQGWQARFSLLNLYVEEIRQNIAFWAQNMKEDAQGGEASAADAQGGEASTADAQGGEASTADAQGGATSTADAQNKHKKQGEHVRRDVLKELFIDEASMEDFIKRATGKEHGSEVVRLYLKNKGRQEGVTQRRASKVLTEGGFPVTEANYSAAKRKSAL